MLFKVPINAESGMKANNTMIKVFTTPTTPPVILCFFAPGLYFKKILAIILYMIYIISSTTAVSTINTTTFASADGSCAKKLSRLGFAFTNASISSLADFIISTR